MARTILHIDMDAFFAAVEVLDDPTLKGKPVIVGGSTSRGVVSTANYEARRFGVHSALPLFKARGKCPHGVFLPVRKERYSAVSRQIMDILEDFTPLVEQVSIDEAYLDITGTEGLFGSPEELARRIKERVGKDIKLTCSIGIAPNKLLAKIASDMNKPDGLTILSADEVDAFLSRLPVEKIPGVGRRSAESLERLRVKRVGDLTQFSEEYLVRVFGKFGQRLYELARGVDDSDVVSDREIKSISSEETLGSDTSNLDILKNHVRTQADHVAWRLRNEGLEGKTITVKLRFSDFSAATRGRTIAQTTDSSRIITDYAIGLLLEKPLKRKVRLIGVAVSNLKQARKEAQMHLFEKEPGSAKERQVDGAVDTIRKKFGGKVIMRGDHAGDS